MAEAWQQWRAALATDRAHERQRWTSLRLDFGPGDYEGVWDLEDALDVLDPGDPADAPALIEVPRYLANQRRRRLRERMQDPQVRQDFRDLASPPSQPDAVGEAAAACTARAVREPCHRV